MEIGKNTVLGFVSGVDDNLYRVVDSGSDIGDAILSSMSAGKMVVRLQSNLSLGLLVMISIP